MSSRVKACRWVLITHFVTAMICGIPMLFFLGRAAIWIHWGPGGRWIDTTGDKVLGAALVALGVGSLLAARDPVRYRIIVQQEIVFTFLAAAALAYRLLHLNATTPTFAWVFFGVLAAYLVLFSLLYPPARPE